MKPKSNVKWDALNVNQCENFFSFLYFSLYPFSTSSRVCLILIKYISNKVHVNGLNLTISIFLFSSMFFLRLFFFFRRYRIRVWACVSVCIYAKPNLLKKYFYLILFRFKWIFTSRFFFSAWNLLLLLCRTAKWSILDKMSYTFVCLSFSFLFFNCFVVVPFSI